MWYVLTDNLDFDIDLDQSLRQRVDLDETRVHSSCEASKLRDQAYITLCYRFVWVWAHYAARNGS